MVLWIRFAVILVLSCLACVKTENNFQRISSTSIDLMQRGFQGYCAKIPGCRYGKILSALKDILNVNSAAAAAAEATNYNNVKVKKNLGQDRAEVLEGSESLEGEPISEESGLKIGDLLERNINILNTNDSLDFLKIDDIKRGHSSPTTGCDCRVTNELLDLGHLYYPRYLLNAVCQKEDESYEYPPKCWRGAQCRPLEYKVRVLTHRSHNEHLQKDPTTSLLPENLRSLWKFKTVTVAAGCFCS